MPKEKTAKNLVLGAKGAWCLQAVAMYFGFFGTWPAAREMQMSYGYSISYWTNMFDLFVERGFAEEVRVASGVTGETYTRYFPTRVSAVSCAELANCLLPTCVDSARAVVREYESRVASHKRAMPQPVVAQPKEKKVRKANKDVRQL